MKEHCGMEQRLKLWTVLMLTDLTEAIVERMVGFYNLRCAISGKIVYIQSSPKTNNICHIKLSVLLRSSKKLYCQPMLIIEPCVFT